MFITLLLFCFIHYCFSWMEESIIPDIECGSRLVIDEAQIFFTSDIPTVALYGVNNQCYKCSKSLIAKPNTGLCTGIYVPHGWKLYIMDINNQVLAHRGYDFGEHGHYTVDFTSSSLELSVTVTTEPIDSLKPIWVAMGLISIVVILSFSIPKLIDLDKLYNKVIIVFSSESANKIDSKENTAYSPLATSEKLGNAETGSGGDTPSLAEQVKKPASQRLCSLDTFRGISLTFMIFVNYGAGSYWFFDHAAWNGLTIADLLFPWFMFMMGVSMALSYAALEKRKTPINTLWYKAIRRSLILFTIGMFMANGYHYRNWRIPGVLQYFAFSNFVTAATVLYFKPWTTELLSRIPKAPTSEHTIENWNRHSDDVTGLFKTFRFSVCEGTYPLTCYKYEWIVQGLLVLLYLCISLGAKIDGCPRGYQGPGGISEDSQYMDCTGGVHRWIDLKLFGVSHIFHYPTCQVLYSCISYDPEGALGSLTACTLTYLGLMIGRVLLHFKEHKDRLLRWGVASFVMLLVAGSLCGFSQNEGLVPLNKNLWSTSFGFVSAGSGTVGLGICYVFCDVLQYWSGAPFLYLGMNSILFYCVHAFFHRYFPFSYSTSSTSHARQLEMNVIGTCCWFIVAYWCYKKKVFLKI